MLFHSFFFEPFPFCGTLVECPHLKRTKTMHFHSFLPPPTGYLPESDVQALLMAIELMCETT